MNNIVLVHGGFVDGSGWGAVYKILTRNGYRVTVVQCLDPNHRAIPRLQTAHQGCG